MLHRRGGAYDGNGTIYENFIIDTSKHLKNSKGGSYHLIYHDTYDNLAQNSEQAETMVTQTLLDQPTRIAAMSASSDNSMAADISAIMEGGFTDRITRIIKYLNGNSDVYG